MSLHKKLNVHQITGLYIRNIVVTNGKRDIHSFILYLFFMQLNFNFLHDDDVLKSYVFCVVVGVSFFFLGRSEISVFHCVNDGFDDDDGNDAIYLKFMHKFMTVYFSFYNNDYIMKQFRLCCIYFMKLIYQCW